MPNMETKKIETIVDMLKTALKELSDKNEVSDSANKTITEAIEDMESWKPRELEKGELSKACSKLENALEEIPDNLEGDAVSSIKAAIKELKEVEKAPDAIIGKFNPEL